MLNMFLRASAFNSDISKWNVSNVTNMLNMFNGASKFNSDISKWDTSKVTNMTSMFNGASKFNCNLGAWDITNIINITTVVDTATIISGMTNMLDSSGLSKDNFSLTLIGWSRIEWTVPGRTFGAIGLSLNNIGEAAKNTLVNTKGWTINLV
jgi:surface protein